MSPNSISPTHTHHPKSSLSLFAPPAIGGNPRIEEGEVMMPLGSQNSGGRSSNLSPLAPPFTLDKPYHKQQHNSNSLSNFTDQPYAPRFDRPRPIWNPPVNSSFGGGFAENGSKDGYPGSHQQPSNGSSSSTRLVPMSSAAGKGYDGFRYGQFTSSAPTIVDKATAYYPPYVVGDERELVARNEPSYDLLSNFDVGQLGGSSQVDDARTVSHVSPQWSGLWNGLNDVEQGKWLDLGGNYGSKDCKPFESSTGQKCTRKGSDAGADRYSFHAGTLPVGSVGSYVETSVKPTNCFDGFRGETSFGSTRIEDHKSFKEPNAGATTVSCGKMSALGSTSAGNENHHLHDPFLQDLHPLPTCGIYEGLVDSRDKHTNYADTYMCDSTSTLRSSPTHWSTFHQLRSPQYAVPCTTVNSVSNGAMDKTEESADFLPYHPFGLNFQVSNYTGNTDSLFTGSSCTKKDDNKYKKQVIDDCLDQLLKTNSVSLIPHLSVAEFAKVKSDTAETFYSMEKYTDSPDIQNTAEDSPCWKGAHFSPFEDSKVVAPDIVSEKTESCLNPDIEEHKNNPTGLDTTDTIHVAGEVCGNTSSKWFSNSNYVSREHDGSCSMMQGLHSPNLYGGDGFQLFDKNHVLDLGIGNELSLFNYSPIPSSSKNSQPWQINSEGCVVMPEETPVPSVAETVAEMKGKCLDTHSSGLPSSSPTNAGDHPFRSTYGNVSASMTTPLSAKDSNSKVDICVLVDTMKNLSEVLVSHCSNSHDASSELDHAALMHIISNLNSCLVKKADQATQTEKGHDQMASKVTTAHTDQNDLGFFPGWKGDSLCSRDQDLSDSSFLKGDAETVRDAETIQAIKRGLDVNFSSEEMQPETVLYKNLWLEAEAALCARTVRSRFNRIKIATKKKDYLKTNDEENVPISNASDVNKVAEAPHEANDSPSSSRCGHQTDMESSLIARFRTLTSLVEDLKSAKVVGGDQRPSLDAETVHIPTFGCPSPNPQCEASDIQASVMARFKTLMSRPDNSDLINTEDEKSPSKENFRPPSPDHYSYFSTMANHNDDPEAAAVLSRFNILKTRIQQSEAVDDAPQFITSILPTEDRFSVHPAGEKVKDYSGASMSSNPGKLPRAVNGIGDELLEGWYDCSEPGWEHVAKEGPPKQN